MKLRPSLIIWLFTSPFLLTGCDLVEQRLGLEDPAKKEARTDAEGRAVGSGCRQSGRAIEDCYAIYNWLPKSSIFAGWREMNDYMQENKLSVVEPKLAPPSSADERRNRRPKSADLDAATENPKQAETNTPTKPAAPPPPSAPAGKR